MTVILDDSVAWPRRAAALLWLPVIVVAVFVDRTGPPGAIPLVVTGLVLASAGWVVMAVRIVGPGWVSPVASLLLTAGGCLLIYARGEWSTASAFCYLAVHMAGVRLPTVRMAIPLTVLTAVAMLLVLPHAGIFQLLLVLATTAAVMLLGVVRRDSARRTAEHESSLVAQARAREEQARAETLNERTRIARDVHDVLAHSLSALAVQLQGARLMALRDGAAPDTIAQIERAQGLATEGLTEARRAVSALRSGPVDVAEGLRALVADHPGAAVEIDDATTLDARAGETVVRVAQEALSNVRKHAPGAAVTVRLCRADGDTVLTVTDRPGAGDAAPTGAPGGQGYGLIGMTERAELIGAHLEAGPTGDGWRVTLRIPGVLDRATATGPREDDR